MKFSTRSIVLAGLIAAVYYVVTVAFAPISYGPIQFRVANLLSPLALFDPALALAFLFGTFLTNIFSPFGVWDFAVMPLVACFAAVLCWKLRKYPWVAITLQALAISVGVAVFPLGLGGGIPVWPTVLFVFISEIAVLYLGYIVIWRKYGRILFPSQNTVEYKSSESTSSV